MITEVKISGVDNADKINLTLEHPYCDKVDLLARWIINNYESNLIKSIINEKYYSDGYFDYDEVYAGAVKLVSKLKNKNLNFIKKQLRILFSETDLISIDGFIRFRLQEYCNILEEEVERSIEEYYVKQEYKDFIDLLKEFVQTEPSTIRTLHIVAQSNDCYTFYDDKLLNITSEIIELYFSDFFEEFNSYDMLLSSLVILSPEHIIIHNPHLIKNEDLLRTIEQIFESRIEFCNGACNLCRL